LEDLHYYCTAHTHTHTHTLTLKLTRISSIIFAGMHSEPHPLMDKM